MFNVSVAIINGTYNVLDFARRHGVNKVVLASSSAIYGDRIPIDITGITLKLNESDTQ